MNDESFAALGVTEIRFECSKQSTNSVHCCLPLSYVENCTPILRHCVKGYFLLYIGINWYRNALPMPIALKQD